MVRYLCGKRRKLSEHLSEFCFNSVDVSMASMVLPKMFETLSQLWLSEKPEVTTCATHAMEVLLKDAVNQICSSPGNVEQNKSKLEKCIQIIECGLGYQYNIVWHQVLYVIKTLFEVSYISNLSTFCNVLQKHIFITLERKILY